MGRRSIEMIRKALAIWAPGARFRVWRGTGPRNYNLDTRLYDGPEEHGYLAIRVDMRGGEAIFLGPTIRKALATISEMISRDQAATGVGILEWERVGVEHRGGPAIEADTAYTVRREDGRRFEVGASFLSASERHALERHKPTTLPRVDAWVQDEQNAAFQGLWKDSQGTDEE